MNKNIKDNNKVNIRSLSNLASDSKLATDPDQRSRIHSRKLAYRAIALSCLILTVIFYYFFYYHSNKENKIIFPILKYKFEQLKSDIPKNEEEEPLDNLASTEDELENTPIIAIILNGPELAQYSSQLPSEINFAINKDEVDKFANDNHFLILNIPLEKENIISRISDDIPNSQKSLEENSIIINDFLDNNYSPIFYGTSDEVFTNKEKNAIVLFEALKKRNKLFISLKNDKTSPLYRFAEKISFKILTNDVILDSTISVEDINNKLSQLESIANNKGYAIASGGAYPLTIELLVKWLEDIKDKKIKIIPIDEFNMILEKRILENITRDFRTNERSR